MLKPEIFVTADVVAVFGGKVLLIKRKNQPFKGSWALPGGHVEKAELLVKAAERELFEETGVEVKGLKQFGVFDAIDRDPRRRTITVAFCGEAKSGKTKAGSDAKEAKWFSFNRLPKLAFDHDEIIEMFRKMKK